MMKDNFRKFYLIFLLSLAIVFSCEKYDTSPKLRPEGVPEDAVWRGGVDGGAWYQIVDRNDSLLRFTFYQDGTGKLSSTGWFRISSNCEKYLQLTNDEILQSITFGTGKNIYLKFVKDNRYCSFEFIDVKDP